MTTTRHPPRWWGPPLALQITGLLLGGLVVAQLVTLGLTLLLPPQPQPQYELGDIARMLAGAAARNAGARSLERSVQTEPPRPAGPGWLTSERSRHDLAGLLGRDAADVRLYFYTPLPFAGTARPLRREVSAAVPSMHGGFMLADYRVSQAARGPGGGFSGGMPGSAFPAAPTTPPVRLPAPAPSPVPVPPSPSIGNGSAAPTGNAAPAPAPAGPSTASATPPGAVGAAPGGPAAIARGAMPGGANPVSAGLLPLLPLLPPSTRTGSSLDADGAPSGMPDTETAPATSRPTPDDPARTRRGAMADVQRDKHTAEPVAPASSPSVSPRLADDRTDARSPGTDDSPGVAPSPTRGLFGLAPVPFVEGDFIAAERLPDGGWAVVQPTPEPFPNAWQRRVLLWFALSAAIVGPLGWLFSRRLVRPLSGFAWAAEQLGRDPTAPILALGGPAEVGRAANAFNRMQSRLRSFVDDRTAMIGAISHDLRTPLTRMRFRIEDAPDDLREGMLHEVEDMEKMINSVLAFIRDASEPGSRETLDLRSIVEDVVEDATFVGKDVVLESSEKATVEVDAIGMRRLLENLVENAVKYGARAQVRLFTDRQEAVAEVSDDGPGLPDDEIERVFQPFYRSACARDSGKSGSGLGLAVCRSIARAHGGDVFLRRGERGLVAQVRVPLAYRMSSPSAWAVA